MHGWMGSLPVASDSPTLRCVIPRQPRIVARGAECSGSVPRPNRGNTSMSRSPLGPARRRTFTPYVMLYLLAAAYPSIIFFIVSSAAPQFASEWSRAVSSVMLVCVTVIFVPSASSASA